MEIGRGYHLMYCTNIHPGETWAEVFDGLRTYLPAIKARVSPAGPLAVGLRLSALACHELEQGTYLADFRAWLDAQGLYVPLLNGFPYGGFHGQVVKDHVHRPDWTTPDRLAYTQGLARVLAQLLPPGLEGGISTSPLSYKPWLPPGQPVPPALLAQCTRHLAELVQALVQLRERTGRLIHLDLEPEPDGLLENSAEFIAYYDDLLLPQVTAYLQRHLGLGAAAARQAVFDHVQLCYDVCHFALAYEEPAEVLARLAARGIRVGRVQLSAALRAELPAQPAQRQQLAGQLAAFAESTYLHQVLARHPDGQLTQYPDLVAALPHLAGSPAREWRAHFHVPVFLEQYQQLHSTQADIREVLRLLAAAPVTRYLEVETYTWGVLPPALQQPLGTSIERELLWVQAQFAQALALQARVPVGAGGASTETDTIDA